MNIDLKGRIAVVSGGSHGIGEASALALAEAGADIALCARGKEELIRVSDLIERRGRKCLSLGDIDLAKPRNAGMFADFVFTVFGSVDILVNCVGGVPSFGRFVDLNREDWEQTIALNLLSVVDMCRFFIPLMSGSPNASIINISSLPAHQPGRFNPDYAAAKAAVNAFSKSLSNELAPLGIRVNVICPSTLKGGGWERNVSDRALRDGITEEEAEQRMISEERAKIPLGRPGELSDVADLVVYLASDHARFLTGHTYNVDGGTTRAV